MEGPDPRNVLGSIKALPDQVLHAFQAASKIEVPARYRDCDVLVCCGMGGSGLGARCIETIYADRLKIPLIRVNGYALPQFIDENSVVLCSSYSGTTEEALANWDEAERRGAMLMAIAAEGELIVRAKKAAIPFYHIEPTHNPSGQPRMGIGYSIIGQLTMVRNAGLLDLTEQEIRQAVSAMRSTQSREAEAKTLARQAKGKIVLLAAAEHLIGPLHTTNNQLNENAKTLSFDFEIPELNHHLLEGLKYPPSNKETVLFILFDSPSYSEKNRKRLRITAEVMRQNGIEVIIHEVTAGAKLDEALALIQFGAFVNYHLAMAYGQDPAPIPFVNYFKERLSEQETTGKEGKG